MAPPAEISIPKTSLHTPPDGSSSSKPYTLYNITLRLPLRTFVVQKRYSEFVSLHAALTAAAGGVAPPAPLPGKSWFKSTVSSPELTESRRRGLESYLRAVAESPDRRWRDNQAWRSFLKIPGSGSGGASAASVSGTTTTTSTSRMNIPNKDAANRAAAQDPGTWLDLHAEMKRDLQEARRCLARRDNNSGGGGNDAVEAGSAAKKALLKASGLLSVLGEGLKTMHESKRLLEGEHRRRRDLLAAATQDRSDLEKLSNTISSSAAAAPSSAAAAMGNGGGGAAGGKSSLFGGGGGGAPTTGRRVLGGPPAQETERTRELDNRGVVQLQRQQMDEQDEDVEALGAIIRRQRDMAVQIHQEVELQNEMLDDVTGHADHLQDKVGVAGRRIKKIS